MRLFRDEEHVRNAYQVPGALFAPAQLWQLAKRCTAIASSPTGFRTHVNATKPTLRRPA
jgi:hypothetical protein